eukprot:579854-Prymnesium_polylepis.1
MDDDLLTEMLVHLPIKRRIRFLKNLCKQFAYLVKERKLFGTLYVGALSTGYSDFYLEREATILWKWATGAFSPTHSTL